MGNLIYRSKHLLFLFVLLLNCSRNTDKQKEEFSDTNYLVFEMVDMDIFTPIQIDCEKFTTSFGDEVNQLVIKDKMIIQQLIANFDKQKKMRLDGFGVDTRAKLMVYSSENLNKPDSEYCIGLLAFSQNGECYKMSDTLRKIIRQIKDKK